MASFKSEKISRLCITVCFMSGNVVIARCYVPLAILYGSAGNGCDTVAEAVYVLDMSYGKICFSKENILVIWYKCGKDRTREVFII
jgi:hypothetical protein